MFTIRIVYYFLTQRPGSNIKQFKYLVISMSNNISENRLNFVSLFEDALAKIA